MAYMSKKDVIFINKLSNFLADVYQLLGHLEFDYNQAKDRIIPYMDVVTELLHEADVYFDDDQWDVSQEWLEKRLKFYIKKLEKESKKKVK